jgi:FG-GAP repeat protein/VCBS repeat protein
VILLPLIYAALSAQSDFDFASDNHWDGLGMQVFFIDDINGDGIPEFGCGAFCTDVNNTNTGSVSIYDGGSQALIRRHDGVGLQARLGETAIACGDLDGDGFVDYASGARNERVGGKSKGVVYVWSGLTGNVIHTIPGQAADGNFGRGLACIEDLDGDGIFDLAIGAPAERNFRGVVRIYSGASGVWLAQQEGLTDRGRFGYVISEVGDVDLDGTPDLAVGAPYTDSEKGAVYIISGADGSGLEQFLGTEPNTRLGWQLAGVGDTNNDGKVDLLVGEPCSDKAYLITASTAFILREFQGPIYPTKSGIGHSLAAAGDVDGDGYLDYAIGHPGEWDYNSFLFIGPGGGVSLISGKSGREIRSFEPVQFDDSFGSSMAIYLDPNTQQGGILIGAPAWGDLPGQFAPGMVSGRLLN